MENKLPGSQHFFKIMLPGYDTELRGSSVTNIINLELLMFKAFCQKLSGQHSEVATITSCKGTWEVKIEKSSSGLISFASGWSMFAREHDLRLGNFIVFEHCGNFHFTAKVFDVSACEKMFPVNSTNKIGKTTGGKSKKTSSSDSSEFSTIIRARDNSCRFDTVYIPVAFLRSHRLFHKKRIVLIYSTGEEWPVLLRHYSRNRVTMTRGWSDFCQSKKLKIGDTCTFKFRESPDGCDFLLMDLCISQRHLKH